MPLSPAGRGPWAAASPALSSNPAVMSFVLCSLLHWPEAANGFGRRRFLAAAAGGRGAAFPAKRSVELLEIPGVGPLNLWKLVGGGLWDLAQLKQLYRDKPVCGSAEKMVQFLQVSPGIIHKSHVDTITSFVKDSFGVENQKGQSDAFRDIYN